MADFSINEEQIDAVAKKLSETEEGFAGKSLPSAIGSGEFGSFPLMLTYLGFAAKIAQRGATIKSWHASTDAALHDTAKHSEEHDQDWASVFRADRGKSL